MGGVSVVGPNEMHWNWGLIAAIATVVFGSLATVQTRSLAGENATTLMVFYTVGLTFFTAVPALMVWEPVAPADWPLLLAIGVLAQTGQYHYLRAYQGSPADLLAPFSYLSIVLSSLAGFLAFGEVPAWSTVLGILIIFGALVLTARLDRPRAFTQTKNPRPKGSRGSFLPQRRQNGSHREGSANRLASARPAGPDWP